MWFVKWGGKEIRFSKKQIIVVLGASLDGQQVVLALRVRRKALIPMVLP